MPHKRRGIVLFFVVIVIAMLAVASLALLNVMSVEYESAILRGDDIQARQIVQSGIEYVASVLDSPDNVDLADNPVKFCAIEVVPEQFGHSNRGAGRFTLFSPRLENDQLHGIRFGLVNESTKLSLAAVLDWEQESPGQGLQSLQKLPGMTPTMAESILDWIDTDDEPRTSGGESGYYEQIGVTYRPRNAVPVTLDELLLVRDMTPILLFGTDDGLTYGAKRSNLLQKEQSSSEPQHFAESIPWTFLLTTCSAEKQVDPKGNTKINLNETNLETLESQLREHLGSELNEESVEFLIEWRKSKGNIDNLIDLLDAEGSPFSLNNADAEKRFLTLLDFTATDSSVVIKGRINVNEASRTVLEAVPDLTSEQVSEILGRQRKEPEKQRHAVWLLSERIVDKEMMKKLSKRLTTGGDVYRMQIAGLFDGLPMVNRAEIVLDATAKPAKQILFKDLSGKTLK
jgi:type II secretory pathway component PulK